MKPLKQTQFHNPPVYGNCLQACIASLLELPLDEVPHFVESSNYPYNLHNWLHKRGLWLLETKFEGGIDMRGDFMGYHMIYGKSPRGDFLHSVIGLNGDPFFDSHPSDDMIEGDSKDWEYAFLVKKL